MELFRPRDIYSSASYLFRLTPPRAIPQPSSNNAGNERRLGCWTIICGGRWAGSHHLHSARRGACQSAMLPALVTAAGGGWVTQMQSKYGATAKHAADIWAGDMSDTDSQVYKTIGYYWHAPQDVDSNRGLGCAAPLPTRN